MLMDNILVVKSLQLTAFIESVFMQPLRYNVRKADELLLCRLLGYAAFVPVIKLYFALTFSVIYTYVLTESLNSGPRTSQGGSSLQQYSTA